MKKGIWMVQRAKQLYKKEFKYFATSIKSPIFAAANTGY